jgi:hypothetical protein
MAQHPVPGHTSPEFPALLGLRSTVMKLCPSCRRAFDDSLAFCSKDGHALAPCVPARATAPVLAANPTSRPAMRNTAHFEASSLPVATSARRFRRPLSVAIALVILTFVVSAALGALSSANIHPTVASDAPVTTVTVAETPSNIEQAPRKVEVIQTIAEPNTTPMPARLTPVRSKGSGKGSGATATRRRPDSPRRRACA